MAKRRPRLDAGPHIVRQGDVLLREVPSLPSGRITEWKGKDRSILAYGEVTGHSHRLEGGFVRFRPDDLPAGGLGGFIVTKDEPVKLLHEEHDTSFLLPNTTYQQIAQFDRSNLVAD